MFSGIVQEMGEVTEAGGGRLAVASHTVSLEHTWTVSPSLMLDFRAGVVRIASWAGSQVDANSTGWPMHM